jgi:Zn-dependent protease with chaperone function
MCLLAQIAPGAEQAIQAAAESGRWEAVALVVVMLAIAGMMVWLVKLWITQASKREADTLAQAILREERLGKRIDMLEDYIRTTLKEATDNASKAMLTLNVSMSENTRVVSELIQTLHTTRPCFAVGESQERIVATIAERVCERILLMKKDE